MKRREEQKRFLIEVILYKAQKEEMREHVDVRTHVITSCDYITLDSTWDPSRLKV